MAHTKKVGSTGRFGVKYGHKIRKKVIEVETEQHKKHTCPYCKRAGGVKRLSVGIWTCKKCAVKFAGRAYTPV